MRIRDVMVSLLMMPALIHATEVAPADTSVDTFDKLLAKQIQVVESEYDAKIRANQGQVAAGSFGITPLPGVKQDVNDKEPTVEAIWGLVGKEVAEVNYKGRRIAVSMQEPYISKLDGWKLESIKPYEIVLVQTSGSRVTRRKSITLNWNGNDHSPSAMTVPLGQPSPVVTPTITAPVVR
jgi:hypothetical protein